VTAPPNATATAARRDEGAQKQRDSMACYFPGTATLAGIGLVLYALWHKTIMHVLAVVGLVLEITLVTVSAAGAVAVVAWTARLIRRRRAAAGACTTCERPCQLALPTTPGRRVAAPATPRVAVPATSRAAAPLAAPRVRAAWAGAPQATAGLAATGQAPPERGRPGHAPAHAELGPATSLGWPYLPGPAPGTLAGPAPRPLPADGDPAASLVA
jgi:hypothetical protein